MKNLIRLTELSANDIYDIFHIADEVAERKHFEILKGKCSVLSEFKYQNKSYV